VLRALSCGVLDCTDGETCRVSLSVCDQPVRCSDQWIDVPGSGFGGVMISAKRSNELLGFAQAAWSATERSF